MTLSPGGWSACAEAVAAAYGWPPSTLDELTLDELAWWGEAAKARLEAGQRRGVA